MIAYAGQAPFEMSRQFAQPLAVVWKAWSDPEQLQQWWGPVGCRVELLRFEFRPGGFFHYAMHYPNAPTMWGRWTYREIDAQDRLVWLNAFANERCGIARAPFSEVCPLEIENSVTFTERDGMTTVTLRAVPFGETVAEGEFFDHLRPGLTQGYGGTLDQLTAFLASI